MRVCSAELFVYMLMVDHVIPVHTAGRGLQVGRTVHMAYSKSMEVIGDCGSIVESKTFVQLQPVG